MRSPQMLLQLSVLPDGMLIPEWESAGHRISNRLTLFQQTLTKAFDEDVAKGIYLLGFSELPPNASPSIVFFSQFSRQFVRSLIRIPDLEAHRETVAIEISEAVLAGYLLGAPMMTGAEYLDSGVLKQVWEGMTRVFCQEISAYDGSVEAYLQGKKPDIHIAGRVYFHLVEHRDGDAPFAFMATYSEISNGDGVERHLPLQHAIRSYGDDDLLRLLSTVYSAAEKSRLVTDLIESGELFHPLAWDANETLQFLKEIPLYEASGVLCRIPDWWRARSGRTGVRISFGDDPPTRVGGKALLSFNATLMLDGVEISADEAAVILEQAESLALIKNRWVVVDPEKLKRAIGAYEHAMAHAENGLTLQEAMRLEFQPALLLGTIDPADDDIEMSMDSSDWLATVIRRLKKADPPRSVKPGKDFRAVLRGYQEVGVNWLSWLDTMGLGACLADDMGLGKTVQVLGFLSVLKKRKRKKSSLLVVPASLISNWIAEIETFYPELNVFVAHPGFIGKNGAGQTSAGKKKLLEPDENSLKTLDLVISSYAMVQRNTWLGEQDWAYVILDEAQAIKNPGTRQTRAVKALKSENRLILTGTPVENRISDLWSLFDFLNPGLLGDRKTFAAFAKHVKESATGYERLRAVVSPYILRRLKTDKTVVPDLPDKVELKTYADLSKKQVVLYRKAVDDLAKLLDASEGIQRKGLILSALMRFKQICNHPDQYAGSGLFSGMDSGKFQRLRDICETIYEKRERVLVFTQFKEMTEPLRAFLETVFHHEGLVLHGSVAVKKRQPLIDTFQASPYSPFMVLSLKAGGVGLNLTKANHVIHFDRWWNPAVENQATDRAFRIGQERTVMVHKFVTRGTIEEKIDRMIEDKREMAEQVVGASSGDSLLTEMDNDRLMDMFRLTL